MTETRTSPVIAELERTLATDRYAALFLCAFRSAEAQALPEPARAEMLASLAPYAQGASAEELAEARRWVGLRAKLADLARRAQSLPSAGDPEAAHRAGSAKRRADVLNGIGCAAAAVLMGALSLTCLLPRPLSGFAFVVAFVCAITARVFRVAATSAQRSAADAARIVADDAAMITLRSETEQLRRALLDGPEGTWLREIAAAHPALAIPELQSA